MAAGEIAQAASALLGREVRVEVGGRGGNSRVYIATAAGQRFAVKQYFRHSSDERDRLHAERSFLDFAATAGIACVPRVIAFDAALGIGIYEFIEGRALGADDVTAERVHEAGRFFLALNAHRPAATGLALASEACFTVEDHLRMVDGRVRRLDSIVDTPARRFADDLGRRWVEIRKAVAARGTELEAGFERCISPSDFGFHNALVRPAGDLAFLDFEYAGWDDPAKMLCDFFAHPALPVRAEHFDAFAAQTMSFATHPTALETRARVLFPLFQLKWCCIMLNEFLPGAAERRRFANPMQDQSAARARQLEKAGRLLGSIR